MKQCSALVLIFSAIGFATAQENNSTDKVLGTRHILRFATSNFDNVQEKFREKGFNNENQSQGIMNKFNELVPPDAKLAGKIHDLPQNATSQQFFEALKKIENEIKPADELIIYISSHGYEYTKNSKYRQGDTDQGETLHIATNEPIENWVPMIEITKYLSKTKFRSSKKLVIANCSRKYPSRDSGFATIGKNWENNDQTDEKDPEGRLILNRRVSALEEGRIDVDMNMAIMFACTSGKQVYNNSYSQNNPDSQYGLFENALYEILSAGPSGYKSLEALSEKVETKTNLDAQRLTGKPQLPELVVFASDANSTDAITKWKVGHSEIKETVPDADKKPIIIPVTLKDAINTKSTINKLQIQDLSNLLKDKISPIKENVAKSTKNLDIREDNIIAAKAKVERFIRILNDFNVSIPSNVTPYIAIVRERRRARLEENIRKA